MKKRLMCLLLVVVMAMSLLPMAAMADSSVTVDSKSVEKNMLHLDKSLSCNEDGTYNIKLESYATGVSKTTQVTEAVPTDFVLVLDQSGSMTEQDIPTGYQVAGNDWAPEDFLKVTVNDSGQRSNSITTEQHTYYYNVPGTDEYYEVYYKDRPDNAFETIPTGEGALDYTTYESVLGGDIGGYTYEYGANDSRYSDYSEPVYYLDSDGTYYRVYTYSEGLALRYHLTLFYYDSLGVRHNLGTYTYTWLSILNNTVTGTFYTNAPWSRTGNYIWNYKYTQGYINHGYKPYYTDSEGVEHQLPDSLSVDGEGDTFYTDVLYEKTDDITRVSALKSAVNDFVETVSEQAADNNVNHKVAIVGFSDQLSSYYGTPENTELLTGVDVSGTTGRPYGSISTSDYENALQDVTATEGLEDLNNAVNAIDADGGTQPEYGFYMAESILQNRTEKEYTNAAGNSEPRNTVVIFFTDGHPGNYEYSDQIEAANTVVTAAEALKSDEECSTKIYSIGVFADGDDQPLTFTTTDEINARDNYLYQSDGYYYLRGNTVATTDHNDTIKDYMECVSSQYPDATNFLNHTGTSDTGTSETSRGTENTDGNTYYMKVSDTAGLQRAFESALTDVGGTTTEVVAGTSSEFQDVINTDDFEIPDDATATAYSVSYSTTDGVTFTSGSEVVTTYDTEIDENGKVTVEGFDYSTNYTAVGKDGQKLIVEINGLLPKHSGDVASNTSTTIKPNTVDNPDLVALSLTDSPKDNIGDSTIVIDYNYPILLTDQLGTDSSKNASINGTRNAFSDGKAEGNSGTYSVSGSNMQYQLLDGSINPEGEANESGSTYTGSVVFKKYSGIDSAMIYTADEGWKEVNTLPATSVYYSDSLTDAKSTLNGDGSNSDATSNAVRYDSTNHGKQLSYTFTGTGIDVYSTTAADGKYVVGVLYDSDGNKVDSCVMKNVSNTTRVNVPSIFFHDLAYGTYTLKITASKNVNYLLDGIRIYNPTGTDSEAETVYTEKNEQNATFTNLRELLLEDGTGFGDGIGFFSDTSAADEEDGAEEKTVTINFYDEDGNIDSSKSKTYSYYAHTLTAYEIEGPKNEIYLDEGNAIAFTITNWETVTENNPDIKIMMGISAVSGDAGNVAINGTTDTAVTQVDQYFDVTPGTDGIVSVANPSSSGRLISVTNLKVSGADQAFSVNTETGGLQLMSVDATVSSQSNVLSIAVTEETVAYAAKLNAVRYASTNNAVIADETTTEESEEPAVEPDPEPTVEPDPEPSTTPESDDSSSISKFFSNFVNKLFGRLSRLFGR